MWSELSELLLGLAGAGIALAALYYIIANAQGEQTRLGGEPQGPRREPQGPRHEPQGPRHEPLQDEAAFDPAAGQASFAKEMPLVAEIYIAPEAGAQMRRVAGVEAVANRGLQDDRYFSDAGYWSESDPCEVTLIAQEDLEQASRETGLSFLDGRHRRNFVTRNIDLSGLMGRRFRIGSALFSAARPRPPCLYLQRLTEPGLARALVRRGGIGVHCFQSGTVRSGDPIVILDISISTLLRDRWRSWRARR